jgi:hypothetical protein
MRNGRIASSTHCADRFTQRADLVNANRFRATRCVNKFTRLRGVIAARPNRRTARPQTVALDPAASYHPIVLQRGKR